MPLLKSDYYTSKDYWNQPEGERAELIDGKFYDMAPPSRIHQKISGQIYKIIANYIDSHHTSGSISFGIRNSSNISSSQQHLCMSNNMVLAAFV